MCPRSRTSPECLGRAQAGSSASTCASPKGNRSGRRGSEEPSSARSTLWIAADPPRAMDFVGLAALTDIFFGRIIHVRQQMVPFGTGQPDILLPRDRGGPVGAWLHSGPRHGRRPDFRARLPTTSQRNCGAPTGDSSRPVTSSSIIATLRSADKILQHPLHKGKKRIISASSNK
jgi:hypothetical protein